MHLQAQPCSQGRASAFRVAGINLCSEAEPWQGKASADCRGLPIQLALVDHCAGFDPDKLMLFQHGLPLGYAFGAIFHGLVAAVAGRQVRADFRERVSQGCTLLLQLLDVPKDKAPAGQRRRVKKGPETSAEPAEAPDTRPCPSQEPSSTRVHPESCRLLTSLKYQCASKKASAAHRE